MFFVSAATLMNSANFRCRDASYATRRKPKRLNLTILSGGADFPDDIVGFACASCFARGGVGGKKFSPFFGVRSFLWCVPSSAALLFCPAFRPLQDSPLSSIPSAHLRLQSKIVVERSKEGREKLVKIFPPCERARGVIFGGPEVVFFPPAGRLASRRASDPPPGGAWRDLFPPQVPGRIGFSVGGPIFSGTGKVLLCAGFPPGGGSGF